MKKERKGKSFLEKPYYEGGNKAMSTFIDNHLQYPEKATAEAINGTVVIRYTINYQGKVIETKVISGIGYGCDEEAERVVRLLKFQIGKYRNIKVQFHKTIKIHFHANRVSVPTPKPAKVQATRSISYSITPKTAPSKPKNTPPKSKTSYGYTISIKKT